MKKIAILVEPQDSAEAVEILRSLGVVHVEHQRPAQGQGVALLEEEITLIDAVLRILAQEEFNRHNARQVSLTPKDYKSAARHILDLHSRLNQLKDYAESLQGSISQWQAWGDFNPGTITALKHQGVFIKFYQIPVKAMKGLAIEGIIKTISTFRGLANCLTISRKEINLPFTEIALPKTGLKVMQARLSEDKRTMQSLTADLGQATSYRQAFLRLKNTLGEELKFQQALSGMGESAGLNYLRGYIPVDAVKPLEKAAREQRWGIALSEPGPGDNVPTLIRNPRWAVMIKPMFQLIEVVPGYRELDISLWFLLFFSIFVGMLVGDAGIGLIFLALTFFAQRKWGGRLNHKPLFMLLYLCSASAIIWGALSGTFFGQEWLGPWIRPLIPALRDDKNVQAICFLLGAIHLNIAHAWRAALKLPSLAALAEAGWMLILWGAFFLARMLILGYAFPAWGKGLFISGAILVLFFTHPSRNFLKSIGRGLGSLLLNLFNSFTDVVSYVRLFAVGLAGVAVADAFNKMAMGIGFNNILASCVAALVLVLGHALNILLAPMSILVHGVRLNVLEFCNHADVKWGGFAYNPLRKKEH